MNYKLFDFQKVAFADCMGYFRNKDKKPSIAVLPTGAGKSVLIASLSKELGSKILMIVPSTELLKQNRDWLEKVGVEVSIYSASMNTKDIGEVTLATIQSLKGKARLFTEVGVRYVIVDECHFQIPPDKSSVFSKFMKELQPEKVLGLTATPYILKTSMGESYLKMLNRIRPNFFKSICHVTSVKTVVEAGRWCKLKYIQHLFKTDLLQLNSTGSEYSKESIQLTLDVEGVNNRTYLEIKKLLKDTNNRILCFVDSVETAEKMVLHLNKNFPKTCASVSSNTPKKERTAIVEDFSGMGSIRCVFNYGTLTTGFDFPQLNTIILSRPTNSMALYSQMGGRGCRVHEDKEFCTIIDFCGNVKKFGKIESVEIEDIEGHGWAVFSDGYLRTGFSMGMIPILKSEIGKCSKIVKVIDGDSLITFGKFSGTKVKDLPKPYREWMLYSGDYTFKDEKLRETLALLAENDKAVFINENF